MSKKKQQRQAEKRPNRDVTLVWIGFVVLIVAAAAYWFFQQSQAPSAATIISTVPAPT